MIWSLAPQLLKDNGTCHPQFLVDKDGLLCNRLCERLQPMYPHKDVPGGPNLEAHAQQSTWPSLASHISWSDHRITTELRLWCHHDCSRLPIQVSSCHTHHIWHQSLKHGLTVQGPHVKLHGLLEEVISDQGTQFVSTFMHSLSQLLGIQVVASITYHPQMDSETRKS